MNRFNLKKSMKLSKKNDFYLKKSKEVSGIKRDPMINVEAKPFQVKKWEDIQRKIVRSNNP